jgi:hypothetical protein
VAAGVPVLVMPVVVGVLMAVSLGLVAVLMAIVAVGLRLVRVLMLMLILIDHPSFFLYIFVNLTT